MYIREPYKNVLCTSPLVYSTSIPTYVVYHVQYPLAYLTQVIRRWVYDSAFDSVREFLLVIFDGNESVRLAMAFHPVFDFQSTGVFLYILVDVG